MCDDPQRGDAKHHKALGTPFFALSLQVSKASWLSWNHTIIWVYSACYCWWIHDKNCIKIIPPSCHSTTHMADQERTWQWGELLCSHVIFRHVLQVQRSVLKFTPATWLAALAQKLFHSLSAHFRNWRLLHCQGVRAIKWLWKMHWLT